MVGKKLPAFQFYPGDWRKDPGVQSLSFEERGVWIELLCLMHESEEPGKLLAGGQPIPMDRLARLLGLSASYLEVIITSLITLNVAGRCEKTGALINRRMVRDREVSQVRSKSGVKGGNPNFVRGQPNPYYDNQKDNQLCNQKDNQKITPSSSSSSSSSELNTLELSRKAKFTRPTIEEVAAYCLERGKGVDPETWMDHYESNGWKVGKNPMKDWRAAVRTWEKNQLKLTQPDDDKPRPMTQAEIDAHNAAFRASKERHQHG